MRCPHNNQRFESAASADIDLFGERPRAGENDHLGELRGERASSRKFSGRKRSGGQRSDGALRQFLINGLRRGDFGAPSARWYKRQLDVLRAIEKRNDWRESDV